MVLAVTILLSVPVFALPAAGYVNPYSDVPETCWSYPYISKLNELGIFPDKDVLNRTEAENRGNFVSYLYGMYLALGGQKSFFARTQFTDVAEDDPNRTAIVWAERNGIVNGISETLFAPNNHITRQDACVMMMRFVRYAQLRLGQSVDAAQFVDSLRVRDYARSDVVACQMAAVINGYTDGFFRPTGLITREECAAIVWRLMEASKRNGRAISLQEGAYDALYENFLPMPSPLVPLCESVDLSYFDDVVFIGDSVSQTLEFYSAATGALGGAKFLCAGSLSATNALFPVTDISMHPYWQGEKMLVEDGVAATGASKVYIMLGINSMANGVDSATSDLVRLIDKILTKAPGVQIIIQSVTPMSETSTIISDRLNNDVIDQYNARMLSICEERGWYFINVAEVMRDEDGWLVSRYCSDNYNMGIHFSFEAAAVWVEYLQTHVPERLIPEER